MYVLKRINESHHRFYYTNEDVKSLLLYVFRPELTMDEPFFGKTELCLGCCGSESFELMRPYNQDVETVYNLMATNNIVYAPPTPTNLAMHRVVSFDPGDLVLPQDLNTLGRMLAQFYRQEGYICAYAVHANRNHLHIHLVIARLSFVNGTKFHIPFEVNQLQTIIKKWYSTHEDRLDNDLCFRQYRENILFGDDQLSYGYTPLSIIEQKKRYNKKG